MRRWLVLLLMASGSLPVPDPTPVGSRLEIPAGCLNDEPGLSPDKHIYVEHKAQWDKIADGLPQYTKAQIRRLRESNVGA